MQSYERFPFEGVPHSEAVVTIQATSKRLLSAEYHPTVENLMVAVTADNELKLFDINAPGKVFYPRDV